MNASTTRHSTRPRLRVKLLDPDAEPPRRAHPGDAGLDLSSAEDVLLRPGERARIRTGIAVAIPEGWTGIVCPRSGLAHRHGITLVNAPGVVDAGYRGEIQVVALNTDPREGFQVRRGMRIAQMVLVQYLDDDIELVDELGAAVRGDRGFGSSGTDRLGESHGA